MFSLELFFGFMRFGYRVIEFDLGILEDEVFRGGIFVIKGFY